jgi:hypothetical protein
MKKNEHWPHGVKVALVVAAGASVVLAAWLAVLAVDTPFWSLGNDLKWPLWFRLFREGGPVENVQWVVLAATVVLSAAVAGRCAERDDDVAARFWGLLAVGVAIMLIEDAGNPSQRIFREYFAILTGNDTDLGRLPMFLIVAAIPTYALVRHRAYVLGARHFRAPLLGGYALYGVAGFMSVPANHLTSGYAAWGDRLFESLDGLKRLPHPVWGWASDNTSYVFVDTVLEESLELMAATLLLAAAVSTFLGGARRVASPDPETTAVER